MKKFLLKNVHPDIVFGVAMLWLLGNMFLSMVAWHAYEETVAAACKSLGPVLSIAALFLWATILSWPWMRMFPAKQKKAG